MHNNLSLPILAHWLSCIGKQLCSVGRGFQLCARYMQQWKTPITFWVTVDPVEGVMCTSTVRSSVTIPFRVKIVPDTVDRYSFQVALASSVTVHPSCPGATQTWSGHVLD